jgi:hypothetical protein
MVSWSGFYNAAAQEANQWEQCIESFEYTCPFVCVFFGSVSLGLACMSHDPSIQMVTQSNSNLKDSVPSSTPNVHTCSLRQLPSTQTCSGISSFLRMTLLTPAMYRVPDDKYHATEPEPVSFTHIQDSSSRLRPVPNRPDMAGGPAQLRQTLKRELDAGRIGGVSNSAVMARDKTPRNKHSIGAVRRMENGSSVSM